MKAPVLLIIFNRPDTTKIVFDAIRRARPSKLYISADAPCEGNESDKINCEKARDIVKNIDWECDINYLFLDKNLGCGLGVSNAINWAFKTNDRLIILEDDCVPSLAFFDFCNYCLEKYKNDLRIWEISGLNHFEGKKNLIPDDSYFFSKYAAIWGWATWADRWKQTSLSMYGFEKFINQKYIYNDVNRSDGKAMLRTHYNFYKQLQKMQSPHAWSYQWDFTVFSNRGIGIVPSANLIKNIGIEGVHTKGTGQKVHFIHLNENFTVSKDPDFIQTNYLFDDEYFRIFLKKVSKFKSMSRKIFSLLKKTLILFQRH